VRRRSELFSLRLCGRVCRRVGSRRAEARRNRSPRCPRGTVLRTSRNDHDVTLAADPLFTAEVELHLALEHPHDLLLRFDMDAGPDALPYDHLLVAGENAAADLFADLLLGKAANLLKSTSFGITSSQVRIAFGVAWSRNAQLQSFAKVAPSAPHGSRSRHVLSSSYALTNAERHASQRFRGCGEITNGDVQKHCDSPTSGGHRRRMDLSASAQIPPHRPCSPRYSPFRQ